MLQRAWDAQLSAIIVTAGRVKEVEEALELCGSDGKNRRIYIVFLEQYGKNFLRVY